MDTDARRRLVKFKDHYFHFAHLFERSDTTLGMQMLRYVEVDPLASELPEHFAIVLKLLASC